MESARLIERDNGGRLGIWSARFDAGSRDAASALVAFLRSTQVDSVVEPWTSQIVHAVFPPGAQDRVGECARAARAQYLDAGQPKQLEV